MDKHIIYYSVNKKMNAKVLEKKAAIKSNKYNRLNPKKNPIKPLNINISLSTPKFYLRILITSLPVSSEQLLVSSSCLLVTVK